MFDLLQQSLEFRVVAKQPYGMQDAGSVYGTVVLSPRVFVEA
jgi:hypothetical protein